MVVHVVDAVNHRVPHIKIPAGMPTLCGLRRRGYTPRSIRNFSERNGVSKAASTVEYAFLEHCLREDAGVLTSPR